MCLVENVDADGSPVPAGEPGAKLLITNLYNHDQPLIRFELTDTVAFDPEACPCGRSLRRLRAIEGRADDVIVLDGVAVHPMQFAVLTADRGVREFQVVQRGERLVLRLAIDRGADDAPARVRRQLLARLRSLGVREPLVDVELVDGLERSLAGKLQLVVADPTAG
jgi:phenylacetate-coenzyme A ligase PaaK-like adenylate-forming protein